MRVPKADSPGRRCRRANGTIVGTFGWLPSVVTCVSNPSHSLEVRQPANLEVPGELVAGLAGQSLPGCELTLRRILAAKSDSPARGQRADVVGWSANAPIQAGCEASRWTVGHRTLFGQGEPRQHL